MDRERKQEERAALELLAGMDPLFPRGRIRAGESPDFIVWTGRREKTGIEVTRLTRPDSAAFVDSGHFTPRLTRELLEERIRAKETRLPLYRQKKLARIWLLILASGFSNSRAFNVSNQLDAWELQSDFDRVILLDQSVERLYEAASRYPGQH